MVRQGEAVAGTVKYGANMLPWNELSQRNDFQSRYSAFEDSLVQELNKTPEGCSTEAGTAIHQAFDCYLKRAIEMETAAPESSNQSRVRNGASRVKRVLVSAPYVLRELASNPRPGEFMNSPREFYRKAQARRDNLSLESLTDPRSRFIQDFQPIYKLLVEYPDGLPQEVLVDGQHAIS
jgi:hypothetical protein